MQKVNVRNGCMFGCAWLPPTLARAWGAMAPRFEVPAAYMLAPADCEIIRAFDGALLVAGTFAALAVWVWVGISEMLSVCACSPPSSPSVWPLPKWIGVRPCRFGKPKFTRPSPP